MSDGKTKRETWRVVKIEGVRRTVHVVDVNERAIFDALSTPENDARAAIIAAAPDLLTEHHRSLSAFEDLDSCLERAGYKVTSLERAVARDGIRATKAIIAKAEGRS